MSPSRGISVGASCFRMSTPGSVEIQLNYVSPEHRFQEISKGLVTAMEEYARSRGVSEVRLLSTQSARRMYASLGSRGWPIRHGQQLPDILAALNPNPAAFW